MNNAADVWASVLHILKNKLELTDVSLETWFSGLRAAELREDTLVLIASNEFKKKTIMQYYTEKVREALFMLFSVPMSFVIYTEEEYDGELAPATQEFSNYEEYSFDTFVVGNSNKYAHAAAKAVAERTTTKNYNPLFIWGGSGLGKTHLLYAIAGTYKKRDKNAKITYKKSEDFTNELVTAIREGSVSSFKEKYRESDLLLLDDVQFIAGKESTQEEFFHTFNYLYEANKQIVLTSDRPPKEMPKLEERIRSRFEWGVMMDIQPPDYETRMAIVSLKARRIGLNLSHDQCELIANNVTANVRQLEGAVNKLLAYRDLLEDTNGIEAAERAIRDIFAENPWINPTPEFIIKAVAKYFEIDVGKILGKDRTADINEARKIAMYMVREMTEESYPKIGKVFFRDHSTVMHSVDSIEEQLKTDTALREKIQDVKNSVLTP